MSEEVAFKMKDNVYPVQSAVNSVVVDPTTGALIPFVAVTGFGRVPVVANAADANLKPETQEQLDRIEGMLTVVLRHLNREHDPVILP